MSSPEIEVVPSGQASKSFFICIDGKDEFCREVSKVLIGGPLGFTTSNIGRLSYVDD